MKLRSNPFSRPALLAAAAVGFCLGATSNAHAGTYYWDTDDSGTPGFGTASGTWGTSAIWGTDPAGSGATANTNITTDDDVNFGTDSAGLFAGTITGPSIAQGFLNMTFGSASDAVNLSGGTLNLNTSTGSTITVNNTENTISTTFVNDGSFTKSGDGKLTLSSPHGSFTGATIVNQGTLALTAGNMEDSGLYHSSSITINNGGKIEVGGDNSLHGYRPTSVGMLTIHAGGEMTTTSGVTAWIRGALELNGGTLAANTPDAQYGTWTFGQDVTAINAVTSTMSASQMNWDTGTRTFTVSDADGILNVTGNFARPIGFTGSLNKDGLGTMVLRGANTYTGTTTVTDGKLTYANGGSAHNTSGFTVESGASLELDAVNVLVANHNAAVDKNITVNGGTLLMTANSEARIGNVTLNNGATCTSNRSLTYYDILLADTTIGAATVSVTGNAASVMDGSGGIHLQGVQNFDVADVTSNADADLTVSMVLAGPGATGGAAGGIVKSGAGTLKLSATNSYAGSTTVNDGTLSLGDGTNNTSLADTGEVLVGSGATLHLNFDVGSPDTINKLFLGGTQVVSGTWGSLASSADHKSALITGSGLLNVLSDPPITDPFANWMATNYPTIVSPNNEPGADPDNDGIKNLMEYVLQGGNPGVSTTDTLPTLDASGVNFVFTYYRRAAATGTTQTFEHSPTLGAGSWTPVAIPEGAGVVVTPNSPSAGIDKVEVTVAKGANPKLFGRLQVVK